MNINVDEALEKKNSRMKIRDEFIKMRMGAPMGPKAITYLNKPISPLSQTRIMPIVEKTDV